MGWGLQEKGGGIFRGPQGIEEDQWDRSGCRKERGAVLWVLMEAGEMLLGSLQQEGKYGGAGHSWAHGVLGGH